MLDLIDPAQSEPNHAGDPRFASALRAAVAASGLGLERIQRRLRARGSKVSVATLSYWQSGRSMPGRRDSFEVVGHLEAVLELPSGALMHLVPQRNTGTRGVDSVGRLAAAIGDNIEMPKIFEEIDSRLRRSIEMVSEHLEMVIGPDRTQRSCRQRRIVRAVASGVDRVIVAHSVEDPNAALPIAHAISHCEIGERHVIVEPAVVLTECIFDRVLEKGESMMIEFWVEFGAPHPKDNYHFLHRQMPMREFVIEVRFDPAAPPTHCEWQEFSASNPNILRRSTDVELYATNSVLVVRHDLPPTRYGLQWSWD